MAVYGQAEQSFERPGQGPARRDPEVQAVEGELSKEDLLADPCKFILYYFSHRIKKLEHFHRELIRLSTSKRRALVLYPAAHGKTTLISTLLPIWAICVDPNIRISIIARNHQDAKSIMNAIQAELLANHDLIEDFGPFEDSEDKTKSWSREQIKIARCSRRDPRATIEVYGQGGNVLGHRADWVICDDVVTEKNSATVQQRHSLREWFTLGVSTMPEFMESRLTVVGTLFHPQDLYSDIIDNGTYEIDRNDAIVDEEEHTTLWPEIWPWLRLMEEKRDLGTLQFNKRFRNKAVDPSLQAFREEYVCGGTIGREVYPGCLDRQYTIGEIDPGWTVAGGFDPAVGAGRSAKFCAHVTLAKGSCAEHPNGCLWVVDLKRDQMTLPQQVSTIIERHRRYNASISKVEANSYQKGLWQAVEQKMLEEGAAYKIDAHYTNKQNKHDPEIGIPAMSKWFENGWVHIPWRTPADRSRMQILVDELVQYPGHTTDTVMAFWFAWLSFEEIKAPYVAFNRIKKRLPGFDRVGITRIPNPYYVKKQEAQYSEAASDGASAPVWREEAMPDRAPNSIR